MPTKIRLSRHGKKGKPFYHIVVADARAPRDGRYIERIGSYNPNTNPATIDLNMDDAVSWLDKGAQPTDTVRAILSYKGALYRRHLNKGVAKGALTQEAADAKFTEWLSAKDGKVQAAGDAVAKKKAEEAAAQFKAESAIRLEREKALAAKHSELAEEAAPAEEAATEEAATEEAPAEEAATEEAPAKEAATEEAPAEEAATEEAPAEEAATEEAPAEEAATEEAPAEEAATEEAPAEEAATEEAPAEEAATEEAPAEEAASDEKKSAE